MFKAKISVKYTNDWSIDLADKFNCDISFIYTQNISSHKVIDLMKITNLNSQFSTNHIIEFLSNYSELREVECIEENSKYFIFKIITHMNTLSNNQFFVNHSCFQIGNIVMKNNAEIWEFYTPLKKNIKELISSLKQTHTRAVEVLSIKQYDLSTHNLTQKQYDVLYFLYNNGYFKSPKRITLEEASNILNTTPTNIQKHSMRAIHKICEEFFQDK